MRKSGVASCSWCCWRCPVARQSCRGGRGDIGLHDARRDGAGPSTVRILARLGDRSVERPFGTSDANGRVPDHETDAVKRRLGGKMFTAVAIGRLVDRGLVAFDAPIGRYLPGLAPEFAASPWRNCSTTLPVWATI